MKKPILLFMRSKASKLRRRLITPKGSADVVLGAFFVSAPELSL